MTAAKVPHPDDPSHAGTCPSLTQQPLFITSNGKLATMHEYRRPKKRPRLLIPTEWRAAPALYPQTTKQSISLQPSATAQQLLEPNSKAHSRVSLDQNSSVQAHSQTRQEESAALRCLWPSPAVLDLLLPQSHSLQDPNLRNLLQSGNVGGWPQGV
jgi:hypothetical protein